MSVCLACHCLVACIGCCIRQSLCVSWSSVTACGLQRIQHRHWSHSASPSSAEASEQAWLNAQSWLTEMKRTGNHLLRPTHRRTRNRNTHAVSCIKFAAILGAGQLVATVGMVYCSFSSTHFEFRIERVTALCACLKCSRLLCFWFAYAWIYLPSAIHCML